MILSWREDRWQKESSLFDALGVNVDHQEVLSLTGGGGKTTVIRRLQKECMERNVFHGVSTTTHMQYEKNESFLGIPSLVGDRFYHVILNKADTPQQVRKAMITGAKMLEYGISQVSITSHLLEDTDKGRKIWHLEY